MHLFGRRHWESHNSVSKYDYVEKSPILLLKIEENGRFLEILLMISLQGMDVKYLQTSVLRLSQSHLPN
jgi:hypothetical protein